MNIRELAGALALAAAVAAPAVSSAQTVYHHNYARQTTAVIVSVDKTSVALNNNRHLFLQKGTVIQPTGTTLKPGMRVAVYGTPGGNGAINAYEVDFLGWAHPNHM